MKVTNQTVYIATPCYNKSIPIDYFECIVQTIFALKHHGYNAIVNCRVGGPLLVQNRNTILYEFLESKAEFLMLIDDDTAWNAKDVINLVNKNLPVVGGVCPSKGNPTAFPFKPMLKNDNEVEVCNKTGLLKVEFVGPAFILLKRELIVEMYDTFTNLFYNQPDAEHFYSGSKEGPHRKICSLFKTEIENEDFIGEDVFFCNRIRELGYDILVDPFITLSHDGTVSCLAEKMMIS